jgi:hypothetical protein
MFVFVSENMDVVIAFKHRRCGIYKISESSFYEKHYHNAISKSEISVKECYELDEYLLMLVIFIEYLVLT